MPVHVTRFYFFEPITRAELGGRKCRETVWDKRTKLYYVEVNNEKAYDFYKMMYGRGQPFFSTGMR